MPNLRNLVLRPAKPALGNGHVQRLARRAFTGAGLLRRDPPDRYVFNYRASYAEETDAVVRYLVKVRRLRPEQIAVFAQQDGYGDSGFSGVAKAVRGLQGGEASSVLRLDYKLDAQLVPFQQTSSRERW
jgi:hypothetical protein